MKKLTKQNLLTLADYWRDKASAIEAKYKKDNPDLTEHVTTAFRECATDLEDLANRTEIS